MLSYNQWVNPDSVSIEPWYCCLSLRIVRVNEVLEVLHGFRLQGLGHGGLVRRGCFNDEQSYMHPVKC